MWVIRHDNGEYYVSARIWFEKGCDIFFTNDINKAFKFKTEEGAKNTIRACKMKDVYIEEIKD